MRHKLEGVTMSVGLEALKIFKDKDNAEMRVKYPIIYRDDIDKECKYTPNEDYLYATSSTEKIKNISPWYCFTLIPEKTTAGEPSLITALRFMQFLNWAIYYYNIITDTYNSIPKDPKLQEIKGANEWTTLLADMLEEVTGKTYTEAELEEKTKNAFKKNKFVLKPALFLKLCRFFARAWYEERFSSPNNAVGSVEFAYYVSNYIMSNPTQTTSPHCKRYNSRNDSYKKEVSELFDSEKKLSYPFRGFDIRIEQFNNADTDKNEKTSYGISILQYGCKNDFYMFARLYQYRYKNPIK